MSRWFCVAPRMCDGCLDIVWTISDVKRWRSWAYFFSSFYTSTHTHTVDKKEREKERSNAQQILSIIATLAGGLSVYPEYSERVFYRGIHAQRYRPREWRGDGRCWARVGGLQAILSAIGAAASQGEGQSQYQGHRAEEEIIVIFIVVLINVVVVSGGGRCNSGQLICIMILNNPYVTIRVFWHVITAIFGDSTRGLERDHIANDSQCVSVNIVVVIDSRFLQKDKYVMPS